MPVSPSSAAPPTTTKAARPVTPHSILAQEITDLLTTMTAAGAPTAWLDKLRACEGLAAPLDDYLAASSTQPSPALNDLEAATRALDWDAAYEQGRTKARLEQEMVSGQLEGQFLRMLVALTGASHVLEIGSFTGYASLAMAEALPPDGQLVACEYDPFTAAFARRHLDRTEQADKIDLRVGPALTTLEDLAAEERRFNLIFVDADKQGYSAYFRTVLDRELLPVGGLLCVDNTLYQGQVYAPDGPTDNGRALAAFNREVAAEGRVEQVLLPLRDGLTLIRRIR